MLQVDSSRVTLSRYNNIFIFILTLEVILYYTAVLTNLRFTEDVSLGLGKSKSKSKRL